jgi:hypothetical protein
MPTMKAARLTLRRGRVVVALASAALVAGCSAGASPAAPAPGVAASPSGGLSPVAASPVAASPSSGPSAAAGRPSALPLKTAPPVAVAPTASPTATSSAPAGRPSDLPVKTPPLLVAPPTAEPVLGEAPPELVAAARDDLAGRVSAEEIARVEVVRAEEVVWPDGSLGCRAPGELYQPVQTPGFWIVLRAGGREYDYRSAGAGAPLLCEREIKLNPGG